MKKTCRHKVYAMMAFSISHWFHWNLDEDPWTQLRHKCKDKELQFFSKHDLFSYIGQSYSNSWNFKFLQLYKTAQEYHLEKNYCVSVQSQMVSFDVQINHFSKIYILQITISLQRIPSCFDWHLSCRYSRGRLFISTAGWWQNIYTMIKLISRLEGSH